LLAHEGELGALLLVIESAERGEFAALAPQLAALQMPAEEFNAVMVDAYNWMLGVVRETQGSANG
jgi:hypothetical protein